MAYPKETKRAAQDAYHEARKFGHTKEDARKIRDNWKNSKSTSHDLLKKSLLGVIKIELVLEKLK